MSDLKQRIANLPPNERAVFESRLLKRMATSDIATIRRRETTGPIPLSFSQERLWFLDQLYPGLTAYNEISAYRLDGQLDVDALQRSLDEIMRRHESLRTTFTVRDGEPVQIINPPRPLPLRQIDLTHLPASEWDGQVQCYADEETQRPFDLGRDLMRRATLLRFGARVHVLIVTSHHIASDGWSISIFWRELTTLYGAFVRGESANLPPLPIQYADYALWQRGWLESDRAQAQLAYWRKQLTGAPPVIGLLTDRPRPATQSFRGARQSVLLPRTLLDDLNAFGRSAHATLFMTLLTGFKILLHRYIGQGDLVVGTTIAGRVQPELEELIGFLVNNLVLRTQIAATMTVLEALATVRNTVLDAFANQETPFEAVLDSLRPERSLSHMPLFQVMFSLQNTPPRHLRLPGIMVQQLPTKSHSAKFDLGVSLTEQPDGLRCTIEYCSDLFDEATITRMLGHYQNILEGMIAQPDSQLATLPLLTAAERHQLLVEWNDTRVDFPQEQCVHHLFETQVESTPDAVALCFGDESITYRELNLRANQLAHHLRELGVGPDTPVGFFAERSPEMLIGILAILKSGGAYVPLDPTYPQQRLAFMVDDTRTAILLMPGGRDHPIPKRNLRIVALHADPFQFAQHPITPPSSGVTPDHLAYVMYTSGSTGQPKGIAMHHQPLVNLIEWHRTRARLSEPALTLQFASFGFDASFLEMFSTWCTGGTLVLASEELRRDPQLLCKFLRQQGIERLFVPMVILRQIAEVIAADPTSYRLRVVITTGEQLRITDDIKRMMAGLSDCTLHNQYGPTETHCVTEHVMSGNPMSWADRPPIGRAIPNARMFVVDQRQQLAPIGVPGELYIGGVTVGRGYINRPDLTAERFTPALFSTDGRCYRTGDLVRWLPDGSLEFLGRLDHQVKIRGFRVEPGEVEAALAQHPAVTDCTVIIHENTPGNKRLVAYYVTDATPPPTGGSLLAFLRTLLPEYMTPSLFVQLDKLPITLNGKVDYKALPDVAGLYPVLHSAYTAPRIPLEATLAEIWCAVLDVKQVGVHDNFFDLGGHSLLATQVVSRIRNLLRVDLPLQALFESPTVAQLADNIAIRTGADAFGVAIGGQPHEEAIDKGEEFII